ncbi:hypothetical protein SARC_01909 [Sphaeroforma arctica JP610]|uniref:NADAR domain-containing protein n=1 Tax=Sphaeroforma arctica JP610 TaxID=667725 RepID=A0A0L0GAJ8_9EUKA|nr:hypothetical protein SARC_01909 [Sphaeroforma arctica JP610]KNC85916.1 hypothetical protein SARC_01909 [Sphaeroforma arctica JP610]|eukprot:XP_014159818.1 hypothetical protein SARC_01909 [Sphaeroforma arctica JP610]
MLFNDEKTANAILREKNPEKVKALGRTVARFDPLVWISRSMFLVQQGLRYKFRQNQEMRDIMLGIEGRTLVEAAHYDRVWGVGMHETDTEIVFVDRWRGQNLLGQGLMNVPAELLFKESCRGRRTKKRWI